jgi:UDP-N-acetylmuramoyl-tripeptide--D-alanyl-D-alanine ligase
VGVPLTLFRMDSATRYAVLELGTNSPGEISTLTRLAQPEVGLITNISDCHLAGLRDRSGIVREKSGLLTGLAGRRVSVLNRDDPSFDQLAKAAEGKVVTFGICQRADYMAINMDVDFQGVSFDVEGIRAELSLLGFHSIYNALGAYACARELGIAPERIVSVFEGFESPPMRLKPIQKGSLLVVNDTYNANPGSMESAIKTFSVLPAEGRKVVVLGDMLELAEESPRLHRKVGEQLSCGDFDLVVAVGEEAREYLVGAGRCGIPEERLISYENTDSALQTFPDLITPQDSILVKGSRKMGLERLVDAVLAVGR